LVRVLPDRGYDLGTWRAGPASARQGVDERRRARAPVFLRIGLGGVLGAAGAVAAVEGGAEDDRRRHVQARRVSWRSSPSSATSPASAVCPRTRPIVPGEIAVFRLAVTGGPGSLVLPDMTRGQALTAVVLVHLAINIAHGRRAHRRARSPSRSPVCSSSTSSSWRGLWPGSGCGGGGRGSAAWIVGRLHERCARLRDHQSLHHRRTGSRSRTSRPRGVSCSGSPPRCLSSARRRARPSESGRRGPSSKGGV